MRVEALLLTSVFWSLALVPANAADEAAPSVKISFPDSIGNLNRQEVIDYEKSVPGGGTGVHYAGEFAKASIYIYTGGIAKISTGASSAAVTSQADEAHQTFELMVQRGDYSELKVEKPRLVTVAGMDFLYIAASYTEKGIERLSGFYVTGWQNRFIKVRITCWRSSETKQREFENDLIKKIVMLLKT